MAIKFSNNAESKLAGALTAGATSFSVTATEGAKFPVLGAGDWCMLTLVKMVGGAPVREIVKATARSVDTFTVVRGQEGTTATAFSADDVVMNTLTRDSLNEFVPRGSTEFYPEMRSANFIDKTYTNASATGAVTLDCDLADVFDLTLIGNTTVALSNLPALSGETFTIVVRVSQGLFAFTFTWFAGITWLTTGGAAPAAPAANKTIEFVLSTKDGANWIGRKGASN